MLFDVVAEQVANSGWFNSTEFNNIGAVTSGSVKIPLVVLDLTGAIPGIICMLSYLATAYKGNFNIGLWNKTFIVGSIMAVMKGIFDAVTIMPDSIGWEACKARLTDSGIEQIRSFHFSHGFLPALFRALWNEALGDQGRRVRYCSDMMVSGHTYFAVLFAFSAYKQVDYLLAHSSVKWPRRWIGGLLILDVLTELVLVSAARFHYTVDMLAAIVMVCLLFDSVHVEQVAADWSEGYLWRCPNHFQQKSTFAHLVRGMSGDTVDSNASTIIPSQGEGLVNFRHLAGVAPWARDDADVESAAQE
jgi:hypothetical protein